MSIKSETSSDDCTHRATPYVPLAGRPPVRACIYRRTDPGFDPASLRDATESICRVEEASVGGVRVALTCSPATRSQLACVTAAFTHLTPDVLAPQLMSFHGGFLRQYAAIPLTGPRKDEWGFPADYTGCPEKNDRRFSKAMAAEYARQANGRDLALWRDVNVHCRGVVQDRPAPIPPALLGLTPEWQRLAVPPDGSASANPARG